MANRKLGRTTDIRKSMLKNLTTDLIMYGKITTTEARAKEVKSIASGRPSLKEKTIFHLGNYDDPDGDRNYLCNTILT